MAEQTLWGGGGPHSARTLYDLCGFPLCFRVQPPFVGENRKRTIEKV